MFDFFFVVSEEIVDFINKNEKRVLQSYRYLTDRRSERKTIKLKTTILISRRGCETLSV
jgi:hypothetical protein